MIAAISALGIGLGAILSIIGLLLIAPQVKVHRIEVYSPGSWFYRSGTGLLIIGILALIIDEGMGELAQTGLLMGVTGLSNAVLVGHHEKIQALDNGAEIWDWKKSLMAHMLFAAICLTSLSLFALLI